MPDPLRLPPRDVTNAELYILLEQMNNRLYIMSAEQSRASKRMDKFEGDLSGLLAAWRAGGTLLLLAKAVTVLGAGIAAVWAAVKFWG